MKARIKVAATIALLGAVFAPFAAHAQPSSPHILESPNLNLTASENAATAILAKIPVKQVEHEATTQKSAAAQRRVISVPAERDVADRVAPIVP